MSTVADPAPGKCLPVATILVDWIPRAKASAYLATVRGSNENARPCRQMNALGDVGTSATGARSQLTPRVRRYDPVIWPSRYAPLIVPSETICGGARNGGPPENRLTCPPSWSVAISSGGFPPARAARWSALVSALTCEELTMFWVNRITEPTSPARTRASSPEPGVVPSNPTMIRCPSSFASEAGTCGGAGAGAGAAAPPVGGEAAGCANAATQAVGNAAAVAGADSTAAATAATTLLRRPGISRGS